MNENKIHIAVIGAGTVARDNQIPAFLKCSEAEVTAVFDRHIERAEALAGSYGIPKAYCRLEDVLADKDIDCVSICTGNVSHESLVLAAAEAGKNILCEKPMAISVEQAENMRRAVEKNKTARAKASGTDSPTFLGIYSTTIPEIRPAISITDTGRTPP